MFRQDGSEVAIDALPYMEARCASCDGFQETTRQTSRTGLRAREARFVQIPYCGACAARIDAAARRRGPMLLGGIFASAGVGAAACLFPWLPLPVLLAAPAAVAAGLWVLAAHLLEGRRPPAPATAGGEAVRVSSARGQRTTFFCTNVTWAARFAALNRADAVPARPLRGLRRSGWPLAFVVAPLAAFAALIPANPEIHIDNATGERLQIWVDGEWAEEVAPIASPGPHDRESAGPVRPSIRLPYGPHRIGWSPVGATAPVASMEILVAWNGRHLYNPQMAACHWLEVEVYGLADGWKLDQGPRPIEEFYTFQKVNHWFEDNPASIRTKQNGETRVAVKRFDFCTEMASHGCSLELRHELVACTAGAYPGGQLKAIDRCIEEAVRQCAEEAPATRPTAL